MIKTLIFSAFTCSLLGFSFFEGSESQLLKTSSGVFIIPDEAHVSEDDAANIISIIETQPGIVGGLQYTLGGETNTYGEKSIDELNEVAAHYNTSFFNNQSNLVGVLAVNGAWLCSTHLGPNWCDNNTLYTEAVLGEESMEIEAYHNIDRILKRYGYIEVED